MTQAIGVYSKLLVCPEASLGVPPTTLTGKILQLPINTVSLTAKQNTSKSNTLTGRRDATEAIMGNNDVSGNIVVPNDLKAIGWLLAMAFGSPTTTAIEGQTGFYKHVFKPSKTQPSFSVEKYFQATQIYLYSGCKVSKISASYGGDGELTRTFDILGCKETLPAATMGTATDVGFVRSGNFQAGILLDGTAAQIVTSVTLDTDLGLDNNGFSIGGGGFRTRINEGIITPSGKLTAFFDDNTLMEKAINGTETKIEITETVGTSSLKTILNKVKFARNTPGIPGQGGITQELDFNAFRASDSDPECIQYELVNDVASYAFTGV